MAGTLGTITGQVRLDVRQAVAAYAAVRAQNQRTVYALRGTGDSFVQAGQTMATAGGVMVYAFARVVGAAAEYERKMDFFGAVTDTNARKMQQLSDYTLQLAQDTIYSANEIAEGFIELGKSGISAEQIMQGVGDAMASLGAAGDIPLAQSGQIITSVISQFTLAAEDATRVADLLAGAANASIADISDLGYSLKYVGGIAKTAGLEFDDVATAIAVLANAGIRGSTAGTTLRQMIVSLPGATDDAKDALRDLGIILEDGTNRFYDQQGELKPLSRIYQILQTSMKDLTAEQKTQTLRTIFQTRALSSASVLMRAGADGFREMYGEMSKVTAAEVASKRLDNLSGDLEILKGNIETVIIQAGGPFQETMRGWVQMLTRLVQAYAALDPETQKMIVQTIAITGVALVFMGVISLIIGVIARFVAAMLKMAAGMKFVWTMLRIVVTNLRWAIVLFGGQAVAAFGAFAAAIGISVAALAGIVAIIAAVVIGLVVLYNKWEPFQNLVNGFAAAVWKGIKAIGTFFKLLVTDPQAAWDMLKTGMSNLGKWASQLGGLIRQGMQRGLDAVQAFATRTVEWFRGLPGRVVGLITAFAARLAEIFTFRNIGTALGTFIVMVIQFFALLPVRILSLLGRMALGMVLIFAKLPPKILYFLGYLLGRAIGFMVRLQINLWKFAAKAVIGIIRFFARLPGRIASFLASMVTRALAWLINFAATAPAKAAEIVDGIINWFQKLPERAVEFFLRMVARARELFARMKQNAIDLAIGLFNGVVNNIQDLPSTLSGIVGDMIEAFKDKITEAFNAAKGFAKGLWDGFKDGIGMHSPSHIERAMWQIMGVVNKETDNLQKRTLQVQKLSKQMAKTTFSVGDAGAISAAQGMVRLAMMQSSNTNRARTLQDSAGSARMRDARRDDRRPNRNGGPRKVILDVGGRQFEAYLREIAQDTYDDNEEYDNDLSRMG